MSRGARACGERLARDVPRGRIGVATAVLDHACKMTLSVYVLSVSMRKSACSSEVRRPVRHLYPRARSVRANGETSISRTQGVRATYTKTKEINPVSHGADSIIGCLSMHEYMYMI